MTIVTEQPPKVSKASFLVSSIPKFPYKLARLAV